MAQNLKKKNNKKQNNNGLYSAMVTNNLIKFDRLQE